MPAPESAVTAAAAAYRASLGDTFEESALAYATGEAYRVSGQPARALQAWLDGLAAPTARGWPVMMNALVAVALELGRVQQTADDLAHHADRIPELHLWIGVLAAGAGDVHTAEVAFANAEASTTGDVRFTATTERVRMLLSLDRAADAVDVLGHALALQPAQELALRTSRAGVLNRLGRPEAALEDLDAVLAMAPSFAPAWLNRGSALARLGHDTDARAALDRAVALDPTLAGPARALAGDRP